MTPEQQRIAIAEACGYTNVAPRIVKNVKNEGDDITVGIWSDDGWVPDYLNDLNAMHEAEMILTKLQRMIYVNILWEKCSIAKADPYDWSVSSKPTLRAEAFLHTIGKWKEAK